MTTAKVSAEHQAPVIGLGPRLRALRTARSLTLDALADRAGLDKSHLSRLERGLKAPSIATVLRLADALGTPVSELFGESIAEHAVRVLRRAERPGADGNTARFEMLSRAGAALEAFVIYPPQQFTVPEEASIHPGEELLFVLSGIVEIRFTDRGTVLETGDCVQFPGHLPHRIRRIGEQPASALVTIARASPGRPANKA